MSDINPEITQNAVSVYNDGGMDDFPVLKAFQQYIDAEQEKARKRLLTLGIFFSVLMLAVIAIFVALLVKSSSDNQRLNDRLVEFMMKERERDRTPVTPPVVVQPPVQQDNSAILALTAKLDDLQQKMLESQRKAEAAEKARVEAEKAAAEAARPKVPTAQELEIRELRAIIAAQRDQKDRAQERERRRQEELEAYRRKHYPELYAPSKPAAVTAPRPKRLPAPVAAPVVKDVKEEEELEELDDNDAIDYFKEEAPAASGSKSYSIPVDVKGANSKWRIPND